MEGGRAWAHVAVIGAGSSGLAVLKALREHGITAECFECGSDVGGLWRYGNDNGLSSAYASLRTNVSRARMQYPSFPMPGSYGDFPHHSQMAAYLADFAEMFGLRDLVNFRVTVERLEPDPSGAWRVTLDDGSVRRYEAVVVAIGLFWCPKLPDAPGDFTGQLSHSHDYRTPKPFAGRRVLVVGAGQSAAEIAIEVSGVAARTLMSVRGGAHVIPRWIGGRPYDAADIDPLNRMPWRLMNLIFGKAVARELGPLPRSWPAPTQRPIEGIPIMSSDLIPAVRRGDVVIKPGLEQLRGGRASFADGTGGVDRPGHLCDRVLDQPPVHGPFASHPLPAASFRCIDESFRPVWAASSSPVSSMRPEGSSPWSRCRASGSPPRSQEAFASRRRNGCGRPSTEPSAARGSASRRRAREAFIATRMHTVDCCTRTCGERGGAGSGARLRFQRKVCGTNQ
jgi:Flavin-binding monooxygenase-like